MTAMAHYFAVLASVADFESLDESWRDQVRESVEARFDGRLGPPDWLSGHPQKKLDWGTVACMVAPSEMVRLSPSGAQFVARWGSTCPYVAIWIECY
jgi:hypothetical protein